MSRVQNALNHHVDNKVEYMWPEAGHLGFKMLWATCLDSEGMCSVADTMEV